MRPEVLNRDDIKRKLEDNPLWDLAEGQIVREIVAQNFAEIIGKLNTIAILAEKLDHHPDMLVYGWNKLRISLKTYDVGGITDLDFKLAQMIDELNF